jgi:hypothetical protein
MEIDGITFDKLFPSLFRRVFPRLARAEFADAPQNKTEPESSVPFTNQRKRKS